ncbi:MULTISPECIES: nickel/cobalt ABC transporter permease [unclassified Vibrio]|uniref:nickel/cobalt ABC transporter permease n=1 Tax=unclassified Vibrio TaxID=2614977 RepID=UPI00159E129B|nr:MULTISPECIES: nickel/cobalt ABC transporter permease [unclassified Vibrio]NVN83499.1 ABC transporter permease subunit [Vibrio sp. Scap16]QLE94355.1 ABC transporter permease subunit [Vibrio sp. Scap24]
MIRRLLSNKTVVVCLFILTAICLMGAFAPYLAPHDPNLADVINSMMPMSMEYPLGTDHLGRCIYSRLLFGIRTTLYYSLLTMVITAVVGGFIGVVSGYMRGKVDSLIMRGCEVMLSFPYEIIVLSIVGIMGPGIFNIIIANFIAKIAWYVRIVRSSVISFNHQNYILYSRTVKTPQSFIFRKHLAPNIAAEVIILATLDLGWIILSISTLSFLGLGVQPPTAEWGAMLSDAKEVLFSNPEQMIIPGIAIMVVVACCNLLGDSLRDVLDPRTEQR